MTEPVFQFEEFELHCGRFQLLRKGRPLRVEPKPLELLILLVSRRGNLVTRREIVEKLWEKDVFVETDNSINTAVRKLRHLLRDDPEAPRFIETVTGMGYRFVAPVQGEPQPESIESRSNVRIEANREPTATDRDTDVAPIEPFHADGYEDASSRSPGIESHVHQARSTVRNSVPQILPDSLGIRMPRRNNPKWVFFVGVAVAAVATAIWFEYRPLPSLRIVAFKPITHDGVPKIIVGTDGSRIYVQEGPEHVGEVAVSGGEVAQVPLNLPLANVLDVSLDGSALLIWSYDKGHQSLWSMQMPGGSMRHLVDTGLGSAAWSPDAKSLIYSTTNDEIFISSSDGTEARRLYGAEDHKPGSNTEDLVWSPDKSKIRFTRRAGLWEMTSNGEHLHELLPGWKAGTAKCCGRWTQDGKWFLFLVKDLADPRLPGDQLWAVNERRDSLNPVQLAPGPIRWASSLPGKDGKTIFATGVILRGELVRYDAASQQLRPWLGGISAEFVSYSRAGDFVIYVTFPDGVLWRANRDGSNRVQLTNPPFYPINPHISPDGTRILFSGYDTAGKAKSFVMPSNGGAPQLLVPEDNEEQTDPTWSSDGSKVAYGWPKREQSNTNVIHILDITTRAVITLPGSKGMWSPRWSPNGRYLACLNPTGGIVVFDFQTQRWSEVQTEPGDFPTWSSDSRYLYFLRDSSPPFGVFRIPVTGGSPQRVVDLTEFRSTGVFNFWLDLDLTGAPMLLRDAGSQDIYALTIDQD